MLFQFFPVPGQVTKGGSTFVWQCDACEAKFASTVPLLPTGWSDFRSEDDGGYFRIAFCPDCTASEARGDVQ